MMHLKRYLEENGKIQDSIFFPIKKQNFLKSWEKIEQFWFNLVLKMQLSKVLENIALILKCHLDYCITRNDK
jgi:hypothetical protein